MFRGRLNRKIAESQNDLISRHCDEVENMYRQMRGWRHDYHNHIQAIRACVAAGDTEGLLAYCDQIDRELRTVDRVLKTGNVMLDAILNSKLSLARSREIGVDATASVPRKLRVDDADLCVLIGNLLDNALEACERREDGASPEFEKPFIRVYIGMKGPQLYLCVTNTVYGTPVREGGRFLSTKGSPTHGFGLLRVDRICAKYGGYCSRNSEPGAFTTEILLPVGPEPEQGTEKQS